MANIKNRKKLQLIQTIWDVMLYSQHFTFHWKLLILVSRIEKSGTGDNNFGKWKATFRSDRTKWPDRSQWTPPKLVPNIPVGPNRNDPFHLMNQPKFPEFWVEWKAPQNTDFQFGFRYCSTFMQPIHQGTLQQVPNDPHLPIFLDGLTYNFKVKKLPAYLSKSSSDNYHRSLESTYC